ncbi:MAG: hypothetical protein C4542_09695 [Dehalococcoidia bacterium]|nr:MAG: hypothetical protein C4542_09695 [Dehalococcoidia bacterium]
MYVGLVLPADLSCPLCRQSSGVVHLIPPVDGEWKYYCKGCGYLIVPVELQSKEPLPEGAVGRVTAVRYHLLITEPHTYQQNQEGADAQAV